MPDVEVVVETLSYGSRGAEDYWGVRSFSTQGNLPVESLLFRPWACEKVQALGTRCLSAIGNLRGVAGARKTSYS